jgi:hypothetical protein
MHFQFAMNIWQLMESCWHENPSVRLPSLRIKKTLAKFQPDAADSTSLPTPVSTKLGGISQN